MILVTYSGVSPEQWKIRGLALRLSSRPALHHDGPTLVLRPTTFREKSDEPEEAEGKAD